MQTEKLGNYINILKVQYGCVFCSLLQAVSYQIAFVRLTDLTL